MQKNFFIAVGMDSGYWQVMEEEEEREIMVPTPSPPDEKWRWKVIPMGSLNTATTFVAMMRKLQMEWDTLSKERVLKNLHQKLFLMMC